MSYHKKINSLSKSFLIGFVLIFVGIFNVSAQYIPDADGIIYVRQGGIGDGSSWVNAIDNLQGAIDAAGVVQVWVAEGTYKPVSGQSFSMKRGVAIYGGFPDNNYDAEFNDRNWSAHLTTLQGNGNCVVTNTALTPADVLDGFTITGGNGANGGGVFNSNSSPSYRNLVITQNTATGFGGGMVIAGSSSSPQLTNVLINNNSAAGYGGGVNNTGSPIVTNVTISGNTADGGNEWHDQGTPVIRNSIIYGNGVLGQMNDIQNSLVQNQTNEAYAAVAHNNLPTDTDPLFADPDWDNYTLLRESPAINKGKSALFEGINAGTKDLAGNTRLLDVAIDMGAYESQIIQYVPDANGIIYVRQGGISNGSSWAEATGNLQEAINAEGVTNVWVAKGTYKPVSGQSFSMKRGVAIYGGFPDNNYDAEFNDRNWSAHLTTLQGNWNCVVTNTALTPADVLDGFTITGGSGANGGGVFNSNSSPSYRNLVITQNTTTGFGGGMVIAGSSSSPRLTNMLINNNSAVGNGGGVNNTGSPIVTNVTISGNTADGGNEWHDQGTPVIRNSIIYGNGVLGQMNDVQNSLVQNQTNAAYTNAAHQNLPTDTDPLFAEPASGNYTLLRESPAINKGKSALFDGINAGTKDLAGNTRMFGVEIDMGAYENLILQPVPDANGIIYVRQGGTGDGSSWANATDYLQGAIDAAGVVQVWVAKGTYQPLSGRSFTMKHGVAIYGSFPDNNDHAGMDDRDWVTHLTTLQGNGNGVVANVDNALTPADVLDGFTITGGSGTYGGGIKNINVSPSYRNLVITQNTATGGGGMYITGYSSSPLITNVLISRNYASSSGGGMRCAAAPIITNVTISGNTDSYGGEWAGTSLPVIRNSIIYGNGVSEQIYDIQNSLVQNQTNANYANAAHQNLPTDSNPLFADPTSDNYSLLRESPAINKGKSSLFDGINAGTKDLAGNRRLFDVEIDMGAYESPIFQPAPDANGIIYVRQGGTGDGSSWANATDYLQGAINAAGAEQVWVAKGTYQPLSGRSFTMKHGVGIYGGFPKDNDHASMDDRNWGIHLTRLLGNENTVVTNVDNALTTDDVLDGFTITGGSGVDGGGILNYRSSPSYRNLVIAQNTTTYYGGGMNIIGSSSSPRLTNVLISNNYAGRWGGGVQINSASPTVTNATISGNTDAVGWPEWVNFGSPVIRNSIIYGNGIGGQMYDVQNSLVQNQTNAAYGDVANNNLPTDTDPLFTDPAGGNYSLLSTSPAINKGKNIFFDGLNAGSKDPKGNSRLIGFAIDMGAFESPDGPLPVRLISFEGRLNDQKRAVLTWKTDEINASHYEVERSSNAKDFHIAGTVTAGGNGSANYIFTDPTPVSGNCYYRIRLVDQDDTFSYSRMISLATEGPSKLFAYPNPISDRVTVELGEAYLGSKVRLLSITGALLQETEVKEKNVTFDMSRHAPGIYLLQLHDGRVVKLIKE